MIKQKADIGGSNSSRHYIFKEGLQWVVDEIGIGIQITNYSSIILNIIQQNTGICHITRACKVTFSAVLIVVKSLVYKTSKSAGLKVFLNYQG